MKFVHTGDIHWGMCLSANKPWGKEHAQVIRGTFRVIIEETKKMDVDYSFTSGDLFHRQPLMKDPKEVNYLFPAIPSAKIILIVGNHDRIRGDSALSNFIWSPNVTFIVDKDLASVYFEDINAEVRGFGYHTAEIKTPLLGDVQIPLNSYTQILIAHGGDAAHLPINFNNLELSPFSYVVLGHVHEHCVLADGKIAYCGSPEPLDLTRTGSHGSYAGEIRPVTRKLVNPQFTPVASLQYIPLAMNMSKDTTSKGLCDRISNEIENRGSQHIYRFRIGGMRNPDIEFDLEQLSARYRITEIIDDSKPQYNFSALFTEYSSDMIGFYIQAL